jgi:hypothetical protein
MKKTIKLTNDMNKKEISTTNSDILYRASLYTMSEYENMRAAVNNPTIVEWGVLYGYSTDDWISDTA